MTPVSDPRLKRALERLFERQTAVSLADLSQPDAPLVYVNRAFETLTGYKGAEAIGRNCRFLQGPDTDPDTVAKIRDAIERRQSSAFCLLNYRPDGSPFHNLLMLEPITGARGGTYILGCQYILRMQLLNRRLDDHISTVQGVIGRFDQEGLLVDVAWKSLIARTEAIKLAVDGYMLSLQASE